MEASLFLSRVILQSDICLQLVRTSFLHITGHRLEWLAVGTECLVVNARNFGTMGRG